MTTDRSLLQAVLADEIKTPPVFAEASIRRETAFVIMRDGVRLAAHLHLPPKLPAPCIVVRTPYGRERYEEISMALALRGNAVICQDVRGTGDSEPDSWDFYIHELEDSFDFVDWVTEQAWCDGFIGSMGGSYDGGTQFCMATNPKMTAIMPEVAGLGIAPSHGVRFHMFLNAYSRTVGKGKDKVNVARADFEAQLLEETLATGYFNEPMSSPLPEAVMARFPQLEMMPKAERREWLWKHYNSLTPAGRAEFLKEALGEEIITFDTTTKLNPLFGHGVDPDALMLPRSSTAQLCGAIVAPALVVTGWYDWCLGDTLESFTQLIRHGQEPARRGSRLLITPSAHNVPGYHEGEEDHPALRRTYRTLENLELFLYWYGSVRDGGIDKIPAVTYYLMGANEWRRAAAWPPPEAQSRILYLGGNGILTPEAKEAHAPPDTYIYGPDAPTPTLGGSILSHVYRAGSVDISKVQQRPDVLSYTTAILERDFDVAGPLKLVLYASSSAAETDFYGRLSDVFPDGRAIQLQSGVVRTRYRNAQSEPEALEPGKVYRYEIDMWATANRFAAGHRLRLDISSADFPKFERNQNRGGSPGPSVKATQTIFHDEMQPSHLILSVIGDRALEN